MTFVVSVIPSPSYLFSRLRRPSPQCDATCRSHPWTFSSSGASPSQMVHSTPEMRPSQGEGHSDTLLCCLFFLSKSWYFTFFFFFSCCWALCGCFLSAPQDKTFILPQLSKPNTKVCFLLAVWHPLLTLCLICHFIIRPLTSEVFALLMLISTTTTAKKLHLLNNQSLFQNIYEYVGRLVTSPLWSLTSYP